ncbi:hypothetical protein PV797_06805 [Clostridiaceae bacterium M8S5]|nr:hypothetical protein PV797_13375 [Clostridiaceae bacterium M8S5]WDV47378.1 hypothetical protein PV797_06805 [Clostridiaceae bacterium M8S5]
MSIINTIVKWIISKLDKILPIFSLSENFLNGLDNAITFLIDLLEKANYFIPLDVFVLCLTAMLVVDNFALLMRLGQWVVKTIRG